MSASASTEGVSGLSAPSASTESVPAAPRDRRAERNAATRQEILDAAWQLVREYGLAALTMRDLGSRVGMRAQSLYAYFPSKHAIYDAMFAEGNRDILARLRQLPTRSDPVRALKDQARLYLQFCVEDPVRYQLLYQRTIPGFAPSPESYTPAMEGLDLVWAALEACGVTTGRARDTWTAVISGLAAQQNANEPGGQRWVRLVNDAIDMFLAHHQPGKAKP
ncbi:MAG: TetR/AcrR family transcriptional regulator [Actinomycetota bacterium]|nr:TetR/AcrR family transcriptional regulator [Actinomycetota bacterium]